MSYSSYDYYRSQLPAWGTMQFQFRAPPPPAYQPRPTWTGFDYYRAHAPNPDHNLYYTVMNRTRDFGPSGGVGMHEARIWQRRVYSGIVSLTQLLPADIGIAAAYEAYRYWKHHNRHLFEPLAGFIEREREALVGLAIAEASNLWQMSGRPMDAYGLRDCLESAALTASRIAYTVMEERQAREYEAAEYGVPRTRSRRYSTAASPVVIRAESSGGFADVPYTNPVSMHGRAGSTGSAGFLGSGSPYAGAGASPMPMPMAGGRSSPYGGPEGSPYGMSGFAGAGTSPYAGGAGLAGMPASVGAGSAYGGAGAGGYGGGMGVPASTGPMYNTTPPVGNSFGVPGSTAGGMAYAGGGGGGITFPGGYQPGAMGNPASQMYGANPPSPYGGGAGLPAQSAGYATSQPGYAGSGYNQPMYAQQQQPQQMYADPSMNGMNGRGGGVTTVIANGRAIPAPAGSTITIDTKRKGRSRRVSTSGYEHPRHRSRSVDPLRHEQSMGYTLAAAR